MERKREHGKGKGREGGVEADVAARCGSSCRAPPLGGAATQLWKLYADGRGIGTADRQLGSFQRDHLEKLSFELIPVSRPELFFLSLCPCTGRKNV